MHFVSEKVIKEVIIIEQFVMLHLIASTKDVMFYLAFICLSLFLFVC